MDVIITKSIYPLEGTAARDFRKQDFQGRDCRDVGKGGFAILASA